MARVAAEIVAHKKQIEDIHEADSTVTGTVIEVVKGGLIVDIGLRGFLPASLVELRRVRELQPYIGKTVEAKIIELDKNRNNVVLSRRAWLEQTQSEVRSEFLKQLQKGAIRKGVVSSIVNFGAFVDLGGVDGLGPFLDRRAEWVLEAGGRLSLAKDSRMRPEHVPSMYPRLDEWRAVRDSLDPDRRLTSDLARRLNLLG